MSPTTESVTADALTTLLPRPIDVHRRLGELVREEKILRRLLRLSLAAEREKELRKVEDGDGQKAG